MSANICGMMTWLVGKFRHCRGPESLERCLSEADSSALTKEEDLTNVDIAPAPPHSRNGTFFSPSEQREASSVPTSLSFGNFIRQRGYSAFTILELRHNIS